VETDDNKMDKQKRRERYLEDRVRNEEMKEINFQGKLNLLTC
jgi:hypothetical protein